MNSNSERQTGVNFNYFIHMYVVDVIHNITIIAVAFVVVIISA